MGEAEERAFRQWRLTLRAGVMNALAPGDRDAIIGWAVDIETTAELWGDLHFWFDELERARAESDG